MLLCMHAYMFMIQSYFPLCLAAEEALFLATELGWTTPVVRTDMASVSAVVASVSCKDQCMCAMTMQR